MGIGWICKEWIGAVAVECWSDGRAAASQSARWPAGGAMPYLVRHAHAGDKRAWQGPDRLRPLSAAGRQEAHCLLTQFRDYPISRIVSSPPVRGQQTLQPLAERRDLRVETADALGVEADSPGLVALLLDPAASET